MEVTKGLSFPRMNMLGLTLITIVRKDLKMSLPRRCAEPILNVPAQPLCTANTDFTTTFQKLINLKKKCTS